MKSKLQRPDEYIQCLGPDGKEKKKALELIEGWDSDPQFPITDPKTTAAASVYLASLLVSDKYTQHEVSEMFDRSKQAIRTNYQELNEYNADEEYERTFGSEDSDEIDKYGNSKQRLVTKYRNLKVDYDNKIFHICKRGEGDETLCGEDYPMIDRTAGKHRMRSLVAADVFLCPSCHATVRENGRKIEEALSAPVELVNKTISNYDVVVED